MDLMGLENPLFHNLGFSTSSLAPLSAWVLSLVVAFAYIGYTFKKVPFVLNMQKEVSVFKLIGIISALASGFMEEVVFRRWLMDILFHVGYNEVVQVICSGLLFGLGHGVWFLFKKEIKFAIPAILSTTVLGSLLAVVYIVGGRNVGPCIVAHVLINLIIEPWLMLSSVSGAWNLKGNKQGLTK